MKVCRHKNLGITLSSLGIGSYAVQLVGDGIKYYFFFPSLEQAKGAQAKTERQNFCCIEETVGYLKGMSGGQYYEFKGTHSS